MMSLRLSVTLTAVLLGVSPHATAQGTASAPAQTPPTEDAKAATNSDGKTAGDAKPDAAQSAKTSPAAGDKAPTDHKTDGKTDGPKSGETLPPFELEAPLKLPGEKPADSGEAAGGDLGGIPLARLLEKDSSFSVLGTFKRLLPKYGIASYIHGTFIGGFSFRTFPGAEESDLLNDHPGENSSRFRADFNLFVGAELYNRVFVEAQLGYDAALNRLESTYSYIDLRIFKDFLFVRGGKFFVPMGGLNVYPDPAYMFPMTDFPVFYSSVLPGEWNELGLQLYGRWYWGEQRGISYSVSIVNGLEQRVENPGDPLTGGLVSQMTENYQDKHQPAKSVSLQFNLEPVPGLLFGISGYEGVYTESGSYRVYIVDGHTSWRIGRFTLRGEFATSLQETETERLLRYGGYVLSSYRFRYAEPMLSMGGMRLEGMRELDRIEAAVGLAVYPFPQKVPSASIRMNYIPRWNMATGDLQHHHFGVEARAAF